MLCRLTGGRPPALAHPHLSGQLDALHAAHHRHHAAPGLRRLLAQHSAGVAGGHQRGRRPGGQIQNRVEGSAVHRAAAAGSRLHGGGSNLWGSRRMHEGARMRAAGPRQGSCGACNSRRALGCGRAGHGLAHRHGIISQLRSQAGGGRHQRLGGARGRQRVGSGGAAIGQQGLQGAQGAGHLDGLLLLHVDIRQAGGAGGGDHRRQLARRRRQPVHAAGGGGGGDGATNGGQRLQGVGSIRERRGRLHSDAHSGAGLGARGICVRRVGERQIVGVGACRLHWESKQMAIFTVQGAGASALPSHAPRAQAKSVCSPGGSVRSSNA